MCLQIPTLETPQGAVWESNAIARYIARLSDNGLYGSTSLDAVSSLSTLVRTLWYAL